jgi:hypothetical protein
MPTEPLIGYRHSHANGIRTYNLLISFSEEANSVVAEIAKRVDMTVVKSNIRGDDLESLTNFRNTELPSLISHPHTASAFIIATGAESIPLNSIINELLALNSSFEYLMVSNGLDEEQAIRIAATGATDLNNQSLPGMGVISSPSIHIAYELEPKLLAELISRLRNFGIEPIVHQYSADHHSDLRSWMLEGAHAIISFTPAESYPVGTLLSPVINVSSGSDFHRNFIADFDLDESQSAERIVEEVLGLISRVRVFSEYTKTTLPVLPPASAAPDISLPIGLVVLNEALTSLAQDIAAHFEQVDLLPLTNDWRSFSNTKELLVVLTTGANDELASLQGKSENMQVINLSQEGSLAALAQAAARAISQYK